MLKILSMLDKTVPSDKWICKFMGDWGKKNLGLISNNHWWDSGHVWSVLSLSNYKKK
mgnify:CR=1 FL=1